MSFKSCVENNAPVWKDVMNNRILMCHYEIGIGGIFITLVQTVFYKKLCSFNQILYHVCNCQFFLDSHTELLYNFLVKIDMLSQHITVTYYTPLIKFNKGHQEI